MKGMSYLTYTFLLYEMDCIVIAPNRLGMKIDYHMVGGNGTPD